ncbi:MAG TPA: RNA polymerase sigma factor [Acidobacteriota bacterium]|nr:RNA polymerase sigma factor [Acidobacteriota bacterium]
MKQPEKDEEYMLIVNAKNGSKEAFESLVKKYQKNIYYLCRRMTGAHQSADDLSQETFVKAYFSLSRFKENMNFFPWIRRIAVNSTLNYLKKTEKEKPLSKEPQINSFNPEPHFNQKPLDRIHQDELDIKLRESIQKLPKEQKSVFILKVFEDMSYKEISDSLDIPIGTVMSRLSRARQRLKFSLSEFIEGGTT